MRNLPKSRAFWIALTIVVAVGTATIVTARHYRIYTWNDYRIYLAMDRECHPVWREFNFRRIGAGDLLAEVTASTRPMSMTEDGDITWLSYQIGFTGVGAIAYKGRLVHASAASCCWSKTFFDVRPNELKERMSKLSEKK